MNNLQTLMIKYAQEQEIEILSCILVQDELTIIIHANNVIKLMHLLHDNHELNFEQCVDLCAVDYLLYRKLAHDQIDDNLDALATKISNNINYGCRFSVIYHMLSIKHNWRIRVKALINDNVIPTINSLINIYSGVNWLEREVYDLFGIDFIGHPDLRRILTDYNFIGHPLRKDFPVSGHTEVIYDEIQKKVVYQPITITPREITPRIIRK